jgi:hypothetical protein
MTGDAGMGFASALGHSTTFKRQWDTLKDDLLFGVVG